MNEIKRLDNILCFSLYSVTNALMRQYRPYLKEFDLTYPQFVVLLALYEKDNISLKELGRKPCLIRELSLHWCKSWKQKATLTEYPCRKMSG